jgi:hypothetical protein
MPISVIYVFSLLVNLSINPVSNPNTIANKRDTIRDANCSPPCLTGSELNEGVLPFLPPLKIELKIPPSIAIPILSIGYPQFWMDYAYRSYI